MEFLNLLAMSADVVSITIGIIAIILSRNSEKRSKRNFNEIIKINNLIKKANSPVDC